MAWTNLNFGKHIGKSLPQIILNDSDYFFWAYENRIFKKASLIKESEEIYHKSRNIRIPNNADDKEIEYTAYRQSNKFSHFDVVPADRPYHEGGSITDRRDRLDFYYPRILKDYDKLGYKQFIKNFKFYILKNEKIKLTKKVCEDFFANNDNFYF